MKLIRVHYHICNVLFSFDLKKILHPCSLKRSFKSPWLQESAKHVILTSSIANFFWTKLIFSHRKYIDSENRETRIFDVIPLYNARRTLVIGLCIITILIMLRCIKNSIVIILKKPTMIMFCIALCQRVFEAE